jgi:hypothetical protein
MAFLLEKAEATARAIEINAFEDGEPLSDEASRAWINRLHMIAGVLTRASKTQRRQPLCTDTQIEQGDTDDLHFFIENDKVGDPSWLAGLEADLASYDKDGRPYRITVYLPQEQYDSEPDDQGPTAAERNPSMLRV